MYPIRHKVDNERQVCFNEKKLFMMGNNSINFLKKFKSFVYQVKNEKLTAPHKSKYVCLQRKKVKNSRLP